MVGHSAARATDDGHHFGTLSLVVTEKLADAIHGGKPAHMLYNLASRLQTMAIEYGLVEISPKIDQMIEPAHPLKPGKIKKDEAYCTMTVPLFQGDQLTTAQAAETLEKIQQMTGVASVRFIGAQDDTRRPAPGAAASAAKSAATGATASLG